MRIASAPAGRCFGFGIWLVHQSRGYVLSTVAMPLQVVVPLLRPLLSNTSFVGVTSFCVETGGMHHAYHDDGGGWCAYDDWTLALRMLRRTTNNKIQKAILIDLDVHQVTLQLLACACHNPALLMKGACRSWNTTCDDMCALSSPPTRLHAGQWARPGQDTLQGR